MNVVVVLNDGKTGHLRQSQRVALAVEKALAERGIQSQTKIIRVSFRNQFSARLISGLSLLINSFVFQGRLESLKWVLTEKSFNELMSVKADLIVSCGSSIAGVNWLLSTDQNAKSLVVLKPGLLSFRRFDLVVVPQHDNPSANIKNTRVVVTKGAPNIIEKQYGTALDNLLAMLPSGGAINEGIADLEVGRASSLIDAIAQIFNQEYMAALGMATESPATALQGMGVGGNINAPVIQGQAQKQSSNMNAFSDIGASIMGGLF